MKIPGLYQLELLFRKRLRPAFQKKPKYFLRAVILDLSHYCNARCPFCPRQILKPELKGFMSRKIFYNSMKQIEKIPSVTQITLAAEGEPLMHPDFDEFVDYIKSKGYFIAFPTNMALADKHFDAMMKCDSIMYSIEGSDKESYEKSRIGCPFEKTLENVKEFRKRVEERRAQGLHVPDTHINYIVTKEASPEEFLKLWQPYVDHIRIDPVMPVVNWNKNEKVIETVIGKNLRDKMLPTSPVEKKSCIQPFMLTVVKPNGKLGLCCSDYNIGLNFGTYKEIDRNFQHNENLNKIRTEFEAGAPIICSGCPQHIEVKRETLFEYLPKLRGIEEKYPNVKIYENR